MTFPEQSLQYKPQKLCFFFFKVQLGGILASTLSFSSTFKWPITQAPEYIREGEHLLKAHKEIL